MTGEITNGVRALPPRGRRSGGVTIDRPERRNALNLEVKARLADEMVETWSTTACGSLF